MPITYLYECRRGHRFERVQSIHDSPLKRCPECGSKAARVMLGGLRINQLPAYMSDSNINSRARHREWLKTPAAKAMNLERDGDSDD